MREKLILDTKLSYFNSYDNIRSNNLTNVSILQSGESCFSFELCPNRNLDTELLAELKPNSCSVTWLGHNLSEIKNVEDIPALQLSQKLSSLGQSVILHLAGRLLSETDAVQILNRVKEIGVKNILALQGDAPRADEQRQELHHFQYAADIVKFIRYKSGEYFCIGVAGYPENHPQSRTFTTDIKYLKHKVSSGADFIITQATFNYDHLEYFAKTCKSNDITVPIIPGVFIISSYRTLLSMSTFCNIPIPQDILTIVNKNKDNTDTIREFGIYQATELIKKILSKKGDLFHGVHIFTLNDLKLTGEVLARLGFWKFRIHRPIEQTT